MKKAHGPTMKNSKNVSSQHTINWPLTYVIYLVHDCLDFCYPNLNNFFSKFFVHGRCLDLTIQII